MPDNCVFCDRVKVEERIVGETADFFIVATIGQISDGGYLLLIPKRHVACIAAMSEPEIRLAYYAIQEVRTAVSWEYSFAPVTIFEHGIVGQTVEHAHIHFVPAACDITARVRKDFPDCRIISPITLEEIRHSYLIDPRPYLMWRDQNFNISVCWNPPAPPMYFRIVVAEALGRPERANWRTMDREVDNRLVSETIAHLKPYFS